MWIFFQILYIYAAGLEEGQETPRIEPRIAKIGVKVLPDLPPETPVTLPPSAPDPFSPGTSGTPPSPVYAQVLERRTRLRKSVQIKFDEEAYKDVETQILRPPVRVSDLRRKSYKTASFESKQSIVPVEEIQIAPTGPKPSRLKRPEQFIRPSFTEKSPLIEDEELPPEPLPQELPFKGRDRKITESMRLKSRHKRHPSIPTVPARHVQKTFGPDDIPQAPVTKNYASIGEDRNRECLKNAGISLPGIRHHLPTQNFFLSCIFEAFNMCETFLGLLEFVSDRYPYLKIYSHMRDHLDILNELPDEDDEKESKRIDHELTLIETGNVDLGEIKGICNAIKIKPGNLKKLTPVDVIRLIFDKMIDKNRKYIKPIIRAPFEISVRNVYVCQKCGKSAKFKNSMDEVHSVLKIESDGSSIPHQINSMMFQPQPRATPTTICSCLMPNLDKSGSLRIMGLPDMLCLEIKPKPEKGIDAVAQGSTVTVPARFTMHGNTYDLKACLLKVSEREYGALVNWAGNWFLMNSAGVSAILKLDYFLEANSDIFAAIYEKPE